MLKRLMVFICSLFIFSIFLIACSLSFQDDPPVHIEKAKQQLSELGFTPISMRFIMEYPYKERPWICYCKNSKNEVYGVVLYPNENVRKVQLGTKEHLLKEQIINKLVSLGYKHDQYMDYNLNLTITKDGNFYWVYPQIINNQETPIFLNLSGEPVVNTH